MKKYIISSIAISLLLIAYAIFSFDFIALGALVVLLVVLVLLLLKFNSRVDAISKIIENSNHLKDGEFDSRILNIQGDQDLMDISNNINTLLDNLEAFMREIKTSIEANQNGRYYRKAYSQGLKGMFISNIEEINKTLTNIELSNKDNIKNALAKQLMDMSLGNQNENLTQIDKSLEGDIAFMGCVANKCCNSEHQTGILATIGNVYRHPSQNNKRTTES